MNQLLYGDNLEILRKRIADESIDLCYIDPPFNSKQNYNQIYNHLGKEDTAQAQAFIDTWTWDKLASEGLEEILTSHNPLYTNQLINLMSGLPKVLGKGSLLAYLVSMALRIVEIHRALKPTGSFYLHCDPTASHYLKILSDSIFLPKGGEFRNEIVWKRTFNSGSSKALAQKFPNNSDTIFYYTKSSNFFFQQVIRPYSQGALKRYDKVDEKGRFMWVPLKTVSKEKLEMLRNTGDIREEEKLKYPRYKKYLNEESGAVVDNIWVDVEQLGTKAKERLGYPTQKPEALLERIIRASSKEGDTILDCYCGCGTTIAVAEKLNRNWIGIDITYQSISVILRRLKESFGESIMKQVQLAGIPKDLESARALALKQDDRLRKEFEKWAILTYANDNAIINDKKGADKGIDGIAYMAEGQDQLRQIIFSVKSGKLNLAQIRDLRGVIERENAAIGILLCIEEPTRQMLQECREAGTYKHPLVKQTFDRLQIITIEEVIKGARLSVPLAVDVLKSAERKKSNKNQGSIF